MQTFENYPDLCNSIQLMASNCAVDMHTWNNHLHEINSALSKSEDEISRLKALLISEKRKYLQRFEDDSYEGRMSTRQSLESFINQHNLK